MLRIWGELQMHLSSVPLFAFLATWRLCANSRWTCRTKHRAENTCPVFPANHHTECDCYYEAVTVIFRTMLTEGHTSSYASIRKRLRLTVPQHLLRLGAQRRRGAKNAKQKEKMAGYRPICCRANSLNLVKGDLSQHQNARASGW